MIRIYPFALALALVLTASASLTGSRDIFLSYSTAGTDRSALLPFGRAAASNADALNSAEFWLEPFLLTSLWVTGPFLVPVELFNS